LRRDFRKDLAFRSSKKIVIAIKPDSPIYQELLRKKSSHQKSLAVLIDPEEVDLTATLELIALSEAAGVDYFFVGGSTAHYEDMDKVLSWVKAHSVIPTLIFPGNTSQLHPAADALLFLSLLSGRNADLLIGKQVESMSFLLRHEMEVISTGYLLIDGGKMTTVAYVSNTTPLPRDNHEMALATAMAGAYLGMKLIYLEAGSGALHSVPDAMIKKISEKLHIPLIVGGGICTPEQAQNKLTAGADIIVIGNILEKDPNRITDLSIAVHHHHNITV